MSDNWGADRKFAPNEDRGRGGFGGGFREREGGFREGGFRDRSRCGEAAPCRSLVGRVPAARLPRGGAAAGRASAAGTTQTSGVEGGGGGVPGGGTSLQQQHASPWLD